MGLLDIFRKKKQKDLIYADTLHGGAPIFSQFGTNIYASDVVQQAISCIVMELIKLRPLHVTDYGNDVVPVQGSNSLQRLLENPNPFMTKADFLEKIIWNLFLNYNAFIYPMYYLWENKKTGKKKKVFTGIFPLQPTQVDFLQDTTGNVYVKMWFHTGYNVVLLYDDLIHIRYNYSVNDYMGGDETGQPNHDALLQTLQINNDLLKGVAAAMKSSFAVNAVVKYNTMLDDGTIQDNIKEFEKRLQNSESGLLGIDFKNDYMKINRDVKLVDSDTLKFIDEKILRNFGVPLAILTGDYTTAQYNAFYQKTLEPIITKLNQSFTKGLFTITERSYGNKVMFFPKDLISLSVQETLDMVRMLGDSGTIYENEKRVAFGLMPLPELEGVRMQSLNYVNVEHAAQYQLQQKAEESEEEDEE